MSSKQQRKIKEYRDKFSDKNNVYNYKFFIPYNQNKVVDFLNKMDYRGIDVEIDFSTYAILYLFVSYIYHKKSCDKKDINGEWYYITDNLIRKNLPSFKSLSQNSIINKIKLLCELNMIKRHPKNKIDRKKFFALGDEYEQLIDIKHLKKR